MLNTFFQGLFDSDLTVLISVTDFLLCLGSSLILGLIMAFVYMDRTRYTKSFVITLALLPAVVCVVIMLVNGNVGTGVAVARAFSLVRFRSVPGTAKEICTLFLAMGAGLITGMGYLGFGVLFTCLMSAMFLIYNRLDFGSQKNVVRYKSYDVSAVITGGTFIGTGASGMVQTFSDSEQGVVSVSTGSQSAGTAVTLADQEGNTLLTCTPEESFQVVILSSPDLVSGETYTITIGGASAEVEAT